MHIEVRKPMADEVRAAEDWPEWSKEESEFDWEYGDKETCYIIEGHATVVTPEGEQIMFGEGDWVVFPAGLKCVWKIDQALRKKYKFG